MSLASKIPAILAHIEANAGRLQYNQTVFNVLDGEILPLIHKAIDTQLSGDSRKVAKDRVPPINIMRKVVDKLSTLYSVEPTRTSANSADQGLVDEYSKELDINSIFASTNESFSSVKYGITETYYDEQTRSIRVRACEPDRYLPYGDDPNDKTRVTVMIKFLGSTTKRKDGRELTGKETKNQLKTVNVIALYSDLEILIIDGEGEILADMMTAYGIEDGKNSYGVIPFSVVKRSKYTIIPKKDDDMLAMPVLIPLLMTEVNFGMMFLANPIIVGTDVNVEGLQVSPLSMWSVKTDASSGTAGKIDVLRPDMNIESQSSWIKEQLVLWLESKNIKAKHLVSESSGGVASGVALILEEMDTSEDRAKQATFFAEFESDFWYKYGKIHNVLSAAGKIGVVKKFSDNVIVKTRYNPILVVEDSASIANRANQSYVAGTMSLRRAIKLTNPDISEKDIELEVAQIREDKKAAGNGELQTQNQP